MESNVITDLHLPRKDGNMDQTALDEFATNVRDAWGPISTDLVAATRKALTSLTKANPTEEWLAALVDEKPASRELVRDARNGFMLLAHTENLGQYRPPHDHGRAWVVYAVHSGALRVRTYAKTLTADGKAKLVQRDETMLLPGEARAYLPGDIHDTCCVSDTALLFRFTERDLRHEDQVERKVTRFIDDGGVWTVGNA
jgi:hypothetical protein